MCGAPLGSFEKRVFNEVADAIQRGRFMTRAAADPNPETDRAQTGHVLSQDRQTIRQTGYLHVIYHSSVPKMDGLWVGQSILTCAKDAALTRLKTPRKWARKLGSSLTWLQSLAENCTIQTGDGLPSPGRKMIAIRSDLAAQASECSRLRIERTLQIGFTNSCLQTQQG